MIYDTITIGDAGDTHFPRGAFLYADTEHGESDFREWYAQNDDAGSRVLYVFAARWARAMENAVDGAASPTEIDIARVWVATLHDACRTDGMEIVTNPIDAPANILRQTWKHGEALRRAINSARGRGDLNARRGHLAWQGMESEWRGAVDA